MAQQILSDGSIFQGIRDALDWDERIDACDVLVEVNGGIVTLSGTVRTYSEKTVAVEDSWKIKGVRRVIDKITVSPEIRRSDADIATDVFRLIRDDNRLDATKVAVRVAGGVVELSGAVATLAEKEAAEEDAWFTPGVFDVENHIEVSPLKVRSDAEIRDDVCTTIARDTRITDSTGIDVIVTGGQVLLQGQVQTPQERRAAEEDARFTAGVTSVRNEIEVVPIRL